MIKPFSKKKEELLVTDLDFRPFLSFQRKCHEFIADDERRTKEASAIFSQQIDGKGAVITLPEI